MSQPSTAIQPVPPASPVLKPHDKSLELYLVLGGPPDPLRQMLHQGLAANGWDLKWNPDGWTGIASQGSKAMNFWFGAFAQYHEISFAFQGLPDGTTGLTLYRMGEGCMGGIWGMMKVRKQFKETAELVQNGFNQSGLVRYAGQRPAG